MKTDEIWKDVEGYEDYYMVSNHGRVKSKDRITLANIVNNKYIVRKGRIMADSVSQTTGYKMITLCGANSRTSPCHQHRLVAKAFIPNPENKPHVNHIDSNRQNNHVSNLEWCTPSENMQHSYKYGNNKSGTESPKNKPISKFDLNGNLLEDFYAVSEVVNKYGYSQGTVCMAARGIRKHAYGFIWKFDKERSKTGTFKVDEIG